MSFSLQKLFYLPLIFDFFRTLHPVCTRRTKTPFAWWRLKIAQVHQVVTGVGI